MSGESSEHPERDGPEPLPDDSWDTATTGLHRVIHGHRPPRRRYGALALVVVVTALVAIAVLPVLLGGGWRDEPEPAARSGPDRSSGAPSSPAASGVAVVVTAPPSPAAESLGAPTLGAGVAPLEVEAEATNVRLRRAVVVEVTGASGGLAVRFTGTSGEVQFRSLDVPSGRYRLTVWYAPGGAWSGDVRGTNGPVAVAFAAGSGCCATLTAQVDLAASGTLRIRPSTGDGAYPAIDRIRLDPA